MRLCWSRQLTERGTLLSGYQEQPSLRRVLWKDIWARITIFKCSFLVTFVIINTFLHTDILIRIFPGNNPLMRQLYEVDVPADSLTGGILPSCPALWRYRTQVTLDHFSLTFQQEVLSTDNRRNKVLAEFLQQVTLPAKQRNRSGF